MSKKQNDNLIADLDRVILAAKNNEQEIDQTMVIDTVIIPEATRRYNKYNGDKLAIDISRTEEKKIKKENKKAEKEYKLRAVPDNIKQPFGNSIVDNVKITFCFIGMIVDIFFIESALEAIGLDFNPIIIFCIGAFICCLLGLFAFWLGTRNRDRANRKLNFILWVIFVVVEIFLTVMRILGPTINALNKAKELASKQEIDFSGSPFDYIFTTNNIKELATAIIMLILSIATAVGIYHYAKSIKHGVDYCFRWIQPHKKINKLQQKIDAIGRELTDLRRKLQTEKQMAATEVLDEAILYLNDEGIRLDNNRIEEFRERFNNNKGEQ